MAENKCKVFVGGLAPSTTAEVLTNFFNEFGAVKEATVKMADDHLTGLKRSRGFGFVTFESEFTVNDVVSQAPFMIEEKKVDVKRIEEDRVNGGPEERKIFVGGLPDTCDNDKLRAYFATIDPQIVEAKVMYNPQTNRTRCFGFVTFSSKEHVMKAVQLKDTHYIDGKWIDVNASQKGGKDKGAKGGFQKGGFQPKGFGKGGKGKGKDGKGGKQQPQYPAYAPQQPQYGYGQMQAYADPAYAAAAPMYAYGAPAAPAYGAPAAAAPMYAYGAPAAQQPQQAAATAYAAYAQDPNAAAAAAAAYGAAPSPSYGPAPTPGVPAYGATPQYGVPAAAPAGRASGPY